MFSPRSSSPQEYIPLETFQKNQEDAEDLNDPVIKQKLVSPRRNLFEIVFNGPLEPQDHPVPRISKLSLLEEFPDNFNSKYSKLLRITLLSFYYLFWFGLFYTLLMPYLLQVPQVSNSDIEVVSVTCGANYDFWRGKNQECGLNGEYCPSFNETEDVIIRCPAICNLAKAYNMVPLGDQKIKYKPYIVGGGRDIINKIDDYQLTNPYRADSYPCVAALHAGLISPFNGGCARLSFNSKEQTSFNSTMGSFVGPSLEFLSFFKSSFYLKQNPNDEFINCHDPRFLITFINFIMGIPITYLGSAALVFWTLSIVGFWTICLIEDPIVPINPSDPNNFAHLITLAVERFLPTCFILYVLWHFSIKNTLSQIPETPKQIQVSYVNRILLWYPLFWLGILNNITFDRLPVDRFNFKGLTEQPGAFMIMVPLLLFIFICIIIQAYKLWKSGRFVKFLKFYLVIFFGFLMISFIPNTKFHLHHFIIGIISLPGCSTKGRTSLVLSGLLLGIFISGASRWGLASIIDTIAQWTRGDPIGTVMPPDILGYNTSTGLLNLQVVPTGGNYSRIYETYSSISLLINDIETYIEDRVSSINLKQLFDTDSLKPLIEKSLQSNHLLNNSIKIYLRVGRKIPDSDTYSDFSNAAILNWPSGNLTLPDPGYT